MAIIPGLLDPKDLQGNLCRLTKW